jgi:hypothetical protein
VAAEGAEDVVDGPPLHQLDAHLPLEDVQLGAQKQLAFPAPVADPQPHPDLPAGRVEDVERLKAVGAERGELGGIE